MIHIRGIRWICHTRLFNFFQQKTKTKKNTNTTNILYVAVGTDEYPETVEKGRNNATVYSALRFRVVLVPRRFFAVRLPPT